VPGFSHVYLIVLENHGLSQILDSATAPYLHVLMGRYGLATNYHSVAHPSQPNYLALFSGSTQGVTDDGIHDLGARTLADQLDAAGRSWRVFAQNVPPGCYRGATASDGPDGPGNYARKHEPAISFTGISGSPTRCGNITDFSHFDPAAADFELVIPNLCNDMHDCSVAAGDRFLASFVPRILQSTAWKQGGVLFITFDEGQGSQPVATLVIASDVAPGSRSAVAHDHYSLVRTIENAWGLPCLANSCGANDMHEFFLAASSATIP
jgi:phosphatidylinositol-3-phosphatase